MFLVRWKKTASNKMTDLWLGGDSDLRKAITQAIHSIDQQLQSDPLNLGESRSGKRRIHFVSPLGILYKVDETKSMVRVLQVWHVKR
jgi:mRNA-degrading endonuclease RelE of RelBE toxin-antitoxin system